jgi:hypothetical protein
LEAADHRPPALGKKCEPLRRALQNVGLDSLKATKLETAKARGKNTALAIAKCNCAVKPEEIKAAIWATERWHQAHTRTSLEFKLAANGTAIEEAPATPWSTAHTKLLAASGAIKLVAR